MTRIAFVADVHLANHKRHGGPVVAGINRRCQLILDALASACDSAKELRCQALVVLGDLFDHARPEPQIIRATQDVLARFGGQVFLVVGNHDMVSTRAGDHALGPLASEQVHVVEQPLRVLIGGDVDLYLVPFRPELASEYIARDVAELHGRGWLPNGLRVLGIHAGILADGDTAGTAPWQLKAEDAIKAGVIAEIAKRNSISGVFAGNWHDRRLWPSWTTARLVNFVFQLGALVPTGWDNPGLGGYGTLGIFDGDIGNADYRVIPGPRFIKSTDASEESLLDEVQAVLLVGCRAFVRAQRSDQTEWAAARAWIQTEIAEGRIEAGEAILEKAIPGGALAPVFMPNPEDRVAVNNDIDAYIRAAAGAGLIKAEGFTLDHVRSDCLRFWEEARRKGR